MFLLPREREKLTVSSAQAFVSHDAKTGEVLARTAEDNQTIEEMVRQERFSAGARDQKDADAALAARIAGDARFKLDLDYADENAERLARHKMKNDTMKKAFAIQGQSWLSSSRCPSPC